MSEPTRLMVDIETLGTEPGCAICSIGAVVFDTGGLGDREYGESGADEIWANAPSFDCEILADAYDRVDIAKPWDYWDERCYRTLKSLPGAVDIDRQGDHHDALDDAAHQARVASATLAGWDDE